ncbi:hypothetical protein IMSAGC003_03897 [Lachnospiraceae bacterium]|nr:hypothetical protein [Acetatifactor sp.]GFH97327.1 hypothetical protein IMSAGC003_03897 [Lachnospiraceae bacterium]
MLQKLKSASLKKVMPGIIILFIAAAGLLVYFGPDFITWAKGPVAFEELSINEIENQYVTMTFELTFGTFATEVTTTTRNGAKVSERDTMQYHAVLVGGLDRYVNTNEDLYWEFVGLAVPARYFDTTKIIDRNSDEFFETYDLRALDTTMQITGQILPMDDEMLRHYRSFFREADYTDDEFKEYCAPYYIKVDHLKRGHADFVLFMNALAVILLLWAVYMLIKALTGGYQRKLIKALKAQGEMELERADADFESASEPTKGIRIGRNYLFDCSGAKTDVFALRQVAWAYSHQVNHQKYGRTVSTTYSIILYTENKKSHQLTMPSKAASDQVLDELNRKCPAGIFGYSDQLKQLFNKNYDEFTRLRRQKEAEINQSQGFNDAFGGSGQNQDPYSV